MELEELIDGELAKIFREQVESQYYARQAQTPIGSRQTETLEAYTKRQENQLAKSLEEYQQRLLEGYNAFRESEPGKLVMNKVLESLSNLSLLSAEQFSRVGLPDFYGMDTQEFSKMYEMAFFKIATNELEKASRMFLFLSWISPKFYLSWMGLGVADSLLGKYEEASIIFDKCLELQKNDPYPYFYSAHNCILLGNKDKAKSLFAMATNLWNESDNELQNLFKEIKTEIEAV